MPDLAALAVLWLHIFEHDLVRYVAGAGGVYLIVNRLLARPLAARRIRRTSPPPGQMRREILASLRTVAVFASVALVTVALRRAGLIDAYADAGARGWAYFWFSLAALIVLHDAWFYWTHRLIHHPRLFRLTHRLHHRSHQPTPFAAYAFDTGEAAINAAFMPVGLMLVPASDLAIFLFLAHMMLRNAVGHCGYELMPATRSGRPMFDWLTSVTHHDLHHAQAGWNYGLYFTWWDRLMKTEHPLYHEKFAEAVRRPLDGSAVAALGHAQKGRARGPAFVDGAPGARSQFE